jgi:transcription antitermination factor NusG
MEEYWTCVMASEKYSKREHIPVVINNIKKIVGKNVDIFYIDNKNEKSFDGYFFVKKDLTDLAYEFKNSVYFGNILNSFERVKLIPDNEISKMKESVEKKHEKFFKYGDVLFIKRGVYENLTGICLSVNENDCDVGMKFCTGSFIVKIDKTDLSVQDNIFNYIRKPFYVRKRH